VLFLAENNNAQNDPDDHNKVKQNFAACKTLVFCPKAVFFGFFGHSTANVLKSAGCRL
jgi:hypothetical protein